MAFTTKEQSAKFGRMVVDAGATEEDALKAARAEVPAATMRDVRRACYERAREVNPFLAARYAEGAPGVYEEGAASENTHANALQTAAGRAWGSTNAPTIDPFADAAARSHEEPKP